MKYLIVLTDGAAGEKLEELGNRTTLEAASMPHINDLAARGEWGMVRTIPPGSSPGSDAGNLSIMGYAPDRYLTGRSPLEAAAMGIDMKDTDVSFRVNLITLEGEGAYEELIIRDHSSGEISTEEARELIAALRREFDSEEMELHAGISYRHCLIWHNGSTDVELIPPHDRLGQKAGPNLPSGGYGDMFTAMMKRSYEILRDHPVNLKRIKEGLAPANSMWIWGEGRRPALLPFKDRFGISGTAVSAVDLIKGIAVCAGLDVADVPGATGTLDTDYEGKAEAAVKAFEGGSDFVYIHLEGPDECGHQGDAKGKTDALERIDRRLVAPLAAYLKSTGEDYRILVVPDHRTPVKVRTHTAGPVPYALYDSAREREPDGAGAFNESAGRAGRYFDSGEKLAEYFFRRG